MDIQAMKAELERKTAEVIKTLEAQRDLYLARLDQIQAERAAEERTRIGNTPTCDECGEQHNEEIGCE